MDRVVLNDGSVHVPLNKPRQRWFRYERRLGEVVGAVSAGGGNGKISPDRRSLIPGDTSRKEAHKTDAGPARGSLVAQLQDATSIGMADAASPCLA